MVLPFDLVQKLWPHPIELPEVPRYLPATLPSLAWLQESFGTTDTEKSRTEAKPSEKAPGLNSSTSAPRNHDSLVSRDYYTYSEALSRAEMAGGENPSVDLLHSLSNEQVTSWLIDAETNQKIALTGRLWREMQPNIGRLSLDGDRGHLRAEYGRSFVTGLLAINREQVDAIFGRNTSEPPQARVGRPRGYDWDEFSLEVWTRVYQHGLPETQAELVSEMLEWCELEWGKQPASSTIRERVSKIYERLRPET